MGFTHGKNTFFSLNGVDQSAFANNTDWEESADSHDVTCFGKNSHVFKGGLKNGKCTVSGVYDDTAVGPYDTIRPLIGSNVTAVWRPEGTGSGKPQETVNVLVTDFKISNSVADMVKWTADLQFSDDIAAINQP